MTRWRHGVLLVAAVLPLAWLLSLDPISQDTAYHNFVDTRRLLGIPNFFDVVSNFPFLLIGAAGLQFCFRTSLGPARNAWLVLFVGVGLVSGGSAYYHWCPGNAALVWDRLPMTVGFMGFLAALLGEYVDPRLGSGFLMPLLVVGVGSVLYWKWFDDLRLYAWVQFVPLLLLLVLMVLFRTRHTHRWLLLVAVGWYALAKVAEFHDAAVFRMTGSTVSGHTVKHLLVALSCYSILVMLKKRQRTVGPSKAKGDLSHSALS